MEQADDTDYSLLLDEIEDTLAAFYREREHVVMAQPQMLGRPAVSRATWQSPTNSRARLEKLPDFHQQMQTNERFRRVYENVCAAVDL